MYCACLGETSRQMYRARNPYTDATARSSCVCVSLSRRKARNARSSRRRNGCATRSPMARRFRRSCVGKKALARREDSSYSFDLTIIRESAAHSLSSSSRERERERDGRASRATAVGAGELRRLIAFDDARLGSTQPGSRAAESLGGRPKTIRDSLAQVSYLSVKFPPFLPSPVVGKRERERERSEAASSAHRNRTQSALSFSSGIVCDALVCFFLGLCVTRSKKNKATGLTTSTRGRCAASGSRAAPAFQFCVLMIPN